MDKFNESFVQYVGDWCLDTTDYKIVVTADNGRVFEIKDDLYPEEEGLSVYRQDLDKLIDVLNNLKQFYKENK